MIPVAKLKKAKWVLEREAAIEKNRKARQIRICYEQYTPLQNRGTVVDGK